MTDIRTTGLRERQKEDRRERIIAAAKSLFEKAGIENITIEAIAEIAGISGVTVHNYYGTKSNILLALVAESDSALIDTLARDLVGHPENVSELVLRFFDIICAHTLTHLDKAIWRQVISASVSATEPRFGKLYHELDDRLAQVLIREIGRLNDKKMRITADPVHLGWALFNVQNARFIEFISNDKTEQSVVMQYLRNDLEALFPPTSA
ncbi:TetR/AcrR family transcriptional regulator [Loktanella sp. M215]|uniref:TetR/AcrR family transcriptional regulator n=1 Tax=Loktanella sp. M215 TaxID=2675431 RepID=UPI001F357D76|nr:TetR/AcrR family transcriptional regulator [Loktanella sp. M215]